jgi:FkbM family methyltransferase
MDSVYTLAVKFLRGIRFGYRFKDKLILLLFILNSIVILSLLFAYRGRNKSLELYRRRRPGLSWIQSKSVIIKRENMKVSIPLTLDYLNLLKRDWELQEREFIRSLKLEESNLWILDIGANLGMYTLLFSHWFPRAQIASVEASPINFQNLKQNCELNNLGSRVVLINKAVTDQDHSNIEIIEGGSRSSVLGSRMDERSNQNITGQKIETIRLDTLAMSLGLNKIALLKMDIEGSEKSALTGAQSLLDNRQIKYMIIEYHSAENYEYIVNTLSNQGYTVRGLMTDAFLPKKEVNGHIIAVLEDNDKKISRY